MPKERITIIEADALEWTANNKESFDCAWHDLWTDRGAGEPHLDLWHMRMMINCRATVKRQGAWAFAREVKQRMLKRGFQWIG
jgi:spermidine synthase